MSLTPQLPGWVKGGPGADAPTTSLVPQIAAEVVAPARTSASCQ